MTDCLNCGAALHGPFCASCGQRAVPPNPTVKELAGDAWHELSGYDGRIMATVRGLARPGFLTREYLAGRRAQYLPPLRLYLTVSVVYFLVAAAAPNLGERQTTTGITGPGGVQITVSRPSGGRADMTEEERAALRAQLDAAPWWLQPILHGALEEPESFRSRMLTVMPRVFFALLPVFAAIVALFYRRRPFPTALVFAVHAHAFAFVIFTVTEAAKFTWSPVAAAIIGVSALLFFAVYALRSIRSVFGGGWPVTLAKAAGIAFVYAIVSVPAFAVILFWASWS